MKPLVLALLICICVGVSQAQYVQYVRPTQLSGYVTNKSGAFKGVVLTIGGFSTVTDANGYYKFDFLKRGSVTVRVTPPKKRTVNYTFAIVAGENRKDFLVNW